MKIVAANPPNFEEISEFFPVIKSKPGILYCWGDTIFNPQDVPIPWELRCHEVVHSKRQNGDPESWWKKYLVDEQFRLDEELAAHRREFQVFCKAYTDRNLQTQYLLAMSHRLGGEMYGNMIKVNEAMKLIKGNSQ